MFGRLMTTCGYTPDQIRLLEFPDVIRLSKYLIRHPSQRDLIEAIAKSIGIEVPDGTKPKYMTGAELNALVNATGGKIAGMSAHG